MSMAVTQPHALTQPHANRNAKTKTPIARCGAKCRDGSLCDQYPVKGGTGRCRMHSGKGGGSPIKHGRRSKYARVLGEHFTVSVQDPEILRSEPELALFDAFIAERLEHLQGGFSSEWLAEVRAHFAAMKGAVTSGDARLLAASMSELGSLIEKGGERLAAWEDVLEKASTRSQLASKAQAALAKADRVMTEQGMIVILGQFIDVVAKHGGAELAQKITRVMNHEVFGLQPKALPAGEAK